MTKIEESLNVLQENNIPFFWKDKNIGFIEIQVKGYIIHAWLGTGTYRNPLTGHKGKGVLNLVNYYKFLNDDNSSCNSKSNDFTAEQRISLLELQLNSALERIVELEKKVFGNETTNA